LGEFNPIIFTAKQMQFTSHVLNRSYEITIQVKEKCMMHHINQLVRFSVQAISVVVLMSIPTTALQAQNIGWEGETGVFVTPLAYTAASPAHGLGHPLVAYHFLNGGEVLGDFYNVSVTVGAFSRIEFGYTRALHSLGGDPNFSALWNNGFNIVHGKVNVVLENAGKTQWVPAISVGFIARSQVRNVGGAIQDKDTTNGDVYLVASKTITQTDVPIILSAGVRGTNAQLWGLGGNASEWNAGPSGQQALSSSFLKRPRPFSQLRSHSNRGIRTNYQQP
jgi:hypothetical protein